MNKYRFFRRKQSLVVRADASAQTGTGHIMRCVALSQAWQDHGGQVFFLMAAGAPILGERLKSEGIEVVWTSAAPGSAADAHQTIKLSHNVGAPWVIVDGYHFGSDYQRIIKNSGQHLLVVDDYGHTNHYYADFVLNQNLHADERVYASREPYTQLLLGTRYVLLRREFLNWRGFNREIPKVARKILVTLGGGDDPDDVALNVIQALQHIKMDGLKTIVLIGESNAQYHELQSAIRELRTSIRLQSNVTQMPELMAWADVAISAAGITAWELAFMGVPTLLLIQAENQRGTAECLDALGVATNLGRPTDLSCEKIASELVNLLIAAEKRTEMVDTGRELVDGNGTTRILMHLNADRLHIRDAHEDDCKQLWEWANDPEVRAVSFSPEAIPWERHIQWFSSKLNDPACVLQIAANGDEIPAGQIRYELDGDQAVVSISLDRQFRGKGYGSPLIWRSAQKFFDNTAATTIHAYVKEGNEASVRAFQNAGYRKLERSTVRDQEAVHLVLSRSDDNAR